MAYRHNAIASLFNFLTSLSLGLVLRRDFLENDAKNFVGSLQLDQARMTIGAIDCHTQYVALGAKRNCGKKIEVDP